MSLIKWSDNLSVNVREIDRQHKKLVDYINGFHDAMVQKKTNEAMGKLFAELIQYTATHFSTEEKYFDQFGYPEGAAHKKEHDDLVKKVTDLKQRFDKGRLVLSLEVMNFLRDWLSKHIQDTDKKYSAFFNSKGLK